MKILRILFLLLWILSTVATAYQKNPHTNPPATLAARLDSIPPDVLISVQHKINRFLAQRSNSFPVYRSRKSTPITPGRDLDVKKFTCPQNNGLLMIRGNDLAADISAKSESGRLADMIDRTKLLWNLKHEDDHLYAYETRIDRHGMTHIRLQQVHANIPVYGKELYLHIDKHQQLRCINGRITAVDPCIDVNPSLTPKQAKAKAARFLSLQTCKLSSQLIIYPLPKSEQEVLVYQVNAKPKPDERWELFIDAHNGKLLHAANCTAFDGPAQSSGIDLSGETKTFSTYQIGSDYYLINTSKQMFDAARSQIPDLVVGGILIYSAENDEKDLYYLRSSDKDNWSGAENAVSASVHSAIVYDYYQNVHNRNSIDGQGGTIYVVVNYKQNYNNAFWNGKLIVFGNGDGQRFGDIAGALDVTAHEMTHGVVEYSANLIYEFQSGALNESFADCFGAAVEFFAEGQNGDWLIGEDVTTPGTPGDALRDMQNPSGPRALSKLPGHMDDYRDLPNTEDGDWGGVHINVGIPNRAFALASNAIGLDKTEDIYYRALTNYLTRSSQFVDVRLAAVTVAGDIYGENSVEQNAIKNAYDQVGIVASEPTPPPQQEPTVEGEDWILAVDSQSRKLHRINLDASIIEPISNGEVLSKPSAPDDGSYVLYVDSNYNPRIVSIDGAQEEILDEDNLFRNVSISPDGSYLAATSSLYDDKLYLAGIGENEEVTAFTLYAKTYTEGVQSSVVLYADALDWTLDSKYVLYDAYNEINSGENPTRYWDINILRASDGAIARIFPAQPAGVSIGNPVFASNNDFIIVYDYVDQFGNVFTKTANLETGEIGQVNYNGFALSHPDFSPDDNAIIFQYNDGQNDYVYVTGLQNDGLNGDNNFQQFLISAVFPIWIRHGQRPQTSVTLPEIDRIPQLYELMQNHPNPFNNSTTIEYKLPEAEHVTLSLYNASGQLVKVLVEKNQMSGHHSVSLETTGLASGVYFYQLTTAKTLLRKKMVLIR